MEKLVISIDLQNKEELERIVGKLLKKYNIKADADMGAVAASIEKNIEHPISRAKQMMERFKASTAEWGFVYNGLRGYAQIASEAYNKTIGAVTRAAQEQESASTTLRAALRATGMEVEFNALRLERFASSMQNATIYGDELLMTSMAQMQNIARYTDTGTLERATKAALGLSAAFEIDLATAMDLVGKAGAGNTSMLGRYGIVLDSTLNQSEKFNQVLEIGAGYFSIAEEKAKTSVGSWTQLKNTWGDSLEVLGAGLLPTLTKVSMSLNSMIKSVGLGKSTFEVEKQAIIGQRVEFERLVLVYRNLHFNKNRSIEQNGQYAKTITDLTTKYSNYLGKVNLEKDGWDKISKAISSARTELQNYINQKIQEAVVKNAEDKIVLKSSQIVKYQRELDLLQAEFNAGTKSRITMVKKAADPLSGSPNSGTTTTLSKWGEQEARITTKIKELYVETVEMNKELQSQVEIAQKIYAIPPAPEPKGDGGNGGTGGEGGGSKTTDNERKNLLEEIAAFNRARQVGFDTHRVALQELETEYKANLKLLKGNGDAEASLFLKYEQEKRNLKSEYMKADEDAVKQYYETVKFYDESYYAWKRKQIELEASIMFPGNLSGAKDWAEDHVRGLDKDKVAFSSRVMIDFEGQYEADMSHLAELRELGLATYQEVANKAWEYYHSLKAIVEADGEVSKAEQDKLDVYLGRAQKAQLDVNRESDLASYYNQVKFLDSGYYEWKKARIEEDVRLMQVSEEQKAVILKQRMKELNDERIAGDTHMNFRGKLMKTLGIDASDQEAIVGQYQHIAGQISAIWGQLYSNLESAKNQAFRNLEHRAKSERKSEAWLSAEKEKINAEYEKKVRAMKRIEQKVQIASAMMNTAEGVTNALTQKPAWYAVPAAIAIGTLGAAQVGLIASQKFAKGGQPGLFRGKGTSTSDSNLIAISDNEYIVAADRVRALGVPFFDALNFGNIEQVGKALASIKMPSYNPVNVSQKSSYNTGGQVATQANHNQVIQVTLECDGRTLARAVDRGNKRIIKLN